MTTRDPASSQGVFVGHEPMDSAIVVPFASGVAALFSKRSPIKDTPNEDAAALFPAGEGRGVLAVADGMGGRPAGESASTTVLESLGDAVSEATRASTSLRAAILDGIERGNRAILDLGVGAGTTLAVAVIAEGWMRPVHVGDSGILAVGGRGRLKLQTVMHSPVGYAVESGLLDETEALYHEERHLVSNMIGANDMRIEVGSPLQLSARDTVLLASDGVFDNLSVDEIRELIRSGPLPKVAAQLGRACLDRMNSPDGDAPSKPDDCTFVLWRPRVRSGDGIGRSRLSDP